jgi:hypothetical protein
MPLVVRAIGHTGQTQRLIWNQGNNVPVTAYLWGGGGGGGGNDSNPGGNGSGGAFSTTNFTVNEGDEILCAVGGPGGPGGSGRGAPGGFAGASFMSQGTGTFWDSRSNISNGNFSNGYIGAGQVYSNGAYCSFLNTYGIWNADSLGGVYSRDLNVVWDVSFSDTGYYNFTISCDNRAELYIDGNFACFSDSYVTTFQQLFYITAGTHSIRVVGLNTGGPGSMGLTISGGTNATVFNTRTAVTSPPAYPSTYPGYSTFQNEFGVWEADQGAPSFDRTYSVSFPFTGSYTFQLSVDNYASLYLDDQLILQSTDTFASIPTNTTITVSPGSHTIRLNCSNYGGPGSVALLVTGNNQGSYTGGRGGNSGGAGGSGAGGGGGGATVVTKNGSTMAVAGGGGGGGGGGNVGVATGQSAPGSRGQAPVGTPAGQNGTNKNGDGGGGGGGGGGLGGGNGGESPGGDIGGLAGAFGLGSGTPEAPNGTVPGASNHPYYKGGTAIGGFTAQQGTGGYAVLVFEVGGTFVHQNGSFTVAQKVYIKANDVWNRVKTTWVKINGSWEPVLGFFAPYFTPVPGYWGSQPRDADGDAGSGGGGGGCKIICQKLAEMGYFDSAMNAADQQFGILLRDQDPDAYNGYLRWAQPVVDLLEGKGSTTFRKIVFFWVRDEQRRQQMQSNIVAHYLDVIARPWAEEMAYRMKAEGHNHSNPAGRFIMNIGLPMCRSIGRFNKHRELPMWLKTALIWGTTTVLLVAVTAISTADKVINKVRKLFKRG